MAIGSDIVEGLGSLQLFADLDRPRLEEISHTFDEEIIPQGQRVLRQGLTGSNVYVILEGAADVVARTALRCIVIPGPQLREFLLRHPKVMFQMLRVVTLRLRNTLAWHS